MTHLSRAFAIVLLSTIVGCSSSVDQTTDWAGANVEYRDATASFARPLPTRQMFPGSMPSEPDSEKGARSARGYGTAMAWSFWSCAWQHAIISAAGHPTEARAAHETYERGLADTQYQLVFPDNDGTFQQKVVSPARLGDLAKMKSVYDTDCSWSRSQTGA